jgi:ferric iron reductase protein FhuF
MKTFVLSTLSEVDAVRLETECNLATRLQPDAGRIDPRVLMDRDQAEFLIRDLTDRLQYPSLIVTASQLLKQYSYGLLVPAFYAMTLLDKGLNVGADNCLFEVSFLGEGAWRTRLHLKDREVSSPEGSGRSSWREGVVRAVFRDHLSKVIHTVSEVSGLSTSVLWENASIYLYWMYETYMPGKAAEEQRMRITEDFRYMLNAHPSLFGERKNPLSRFYCDRCTLPGSDQPVRFRKTCCLYCEISNGKLCHTCPKLRQCCR